MKGPETGLSPDAATITDVDSLEAALPEDEIDSGLVKTRAVAGASAVVFRSFAIRGIGLLGNIVLARILTPEDFGLVALGLTIYTFANTIAEGGIAAGFVRGKIAPTRTDLHAAVAVQAYVSSAIVAVCIAVALALGSDQAIVAAVMIVGIPLIAFRMPAYLHFERSLDFGPMIKVEILETLVYFAFTIATVALGAGVWGLAIGQTVRIAVGALMMVELNPGGFIGPRWNNAAIKKMLSFGVRYQAIALGALAVTQGMNVTVASVAGVAGLGVWALVSRLLQIPLMVFSSLRRVSYPAVARLMANEDEDLGQVLLRVAKLSAVMGGVMVVAVLGASDPGVVLAFSEKWKDAENLLPLSVAVVFINGPVSVAAFSYSMASGRLNVGLVNMIAQAIAGPIIVIVFFDSIGLESIALSSCAMAILEAVLLGTVLWQGTRVNLAPVMLFYGAMVAGAGYAGRFVATEMPANWFAVLAGLVVAEAVFAALIIVLQPSVARDTVRLSRRALARG